MLALPKPPFVHASQWPCDTSHFAAVETESQTKLIPHRAERLPQSPATSPSTEGGRNLRRTPESLALPDPCPASPGQLARDPSAGLALGFIPGQTAELSNCMLLSSSICGAVRNPLIFSAELPGRGLAGFSAGPEQAQRGDPISQVLTSLTRTSGCCDDPLRRTLSSLGVGAPYRSLSVRTSLPRGNISEDRCHQKIEESRNEHPNENIKVFSFTY